MVAGRVGLRAPVAPLAWEQPGAIADVAVQPHREHLPAAGAAEGGHPHPGDLPGERLALDVLPTVVAPGRWQRVEVGPALVHGALRCIGSWRRSPRRS